MKSEPKQVEQPTRQDERRDGTPPRYTKPEVRPYGRIEPRLTFSPPGPPP